MGRRFVSSARDLAIADEAWSLEHIELRARYELGMGCPVSERESNSRMSAGASRLDRLGGPGYELTVEESPVSATDAKLRPIRHRPLRAEVEWSAPASLIDGKQLDPDLHIATGAVGSHVPLPCLSRGSGSRLDGESSTHPGLAVLEELDGAFVFLGGGA
jgi:hypothetical protein